MSTTIEARNEEIYQEVVSELRDARKVVRECLSEDERCRNDDRYLMLRVWQKQGIFIIIDFDKWKSVFNPETIRRVRQEIQSTHNGLPGEFLPTDENVLILRKCREEAIRNYYGNQSQIYQRYLSKRYGVQ